MALSLLAANNAQTVLAAGISSTATSLTVNTGTGELFPSPVAGTSFFKLTIIDAATGTLTEIVHVSARNGDVFTIQRAQEGTTARAWSANDIVANMMTAGTLSYILGNFQPLDPTLTALASLVGGADKLPYFTGNDTAGQTDLTSVGRDIIGKASIADILTYLGLGETAKQAAGALQKSQNGGDIPDKAAFIEHIGMKETINPTKRVSIGNIGNGAFDGSTPCINIGDSDSGFIGSADGVIDIYCNNAKVGYIDSSGIHLNDQGLHIGDARMGGDGNIWGTRWNASGQWLWDAIVEQLNTRGTIDWINNQLSIRDRDINARAAISQVIGIGQTYRVVTDKLLGVTYTNTSQKPWVVALKINLPTSGEVQIKVNGVMAAGGNASNSAGVAVWAYPSAIVPAGATYVVESAWGNVIQWVELQ